MPPPAVYGNLLTAAYALVRRRGWLDQPVVSRLFLRAYFAYKRYLEDPFHEIAAARPGLFRGGHILDIGANVGYTALLFARAADPRARVYAFEPDALNYRLLLRALTWAGPVGQRVVPVPVAVGDRVGSVDLLVSERSGADHRVLTEALLARRPSGPRARVPLVTVDAFTREHRIADTVAFVKIDVQGYEPAVWTGMQETLARSRRAVLTLEYDPGILRELGFAPLVVFEDLVRAGYYLETWRRRQGPRAVTPAELETAIEVGSYVDVLATRRTC
jgi:FkbM family methyltransferase